MSGYEANLTPAPVVRQGLLWLRDVLQLRPRKILDPSAGSGVFGMVCGEVWPSAERWGIECRGEEKPHLRRNYDRHRVTRFERSGMLREQTFDLAVTNPPFELALAWLDPLHDLVDGAGVICLLAPEALGQRGREAVDVFQVMPPSLQLRIPGAVAFRGCGINPSTGRKHGSDARCYSWWIWRPGAVHTGSWTVLQLPWLNSQHRRWTVPPGSEWQQSEVHDSGLSAGAALHPNPRIGSQNSDRATSGQRLPDPLEVEADG